MVVAESEILKEINTALVGILEVFDCQRETVVGPNCLSVGDVGDKIIAWIFLGESLRNYFLTAGGKWVDTSMEAYLFENMPEIGACLKSLNLYENEW